MLPGGHIPHDRRLFLLKNRDLEGAQLPSRHCFRHCEGLTAQHTDGVKRTVFATLENSVASLGDRDKFLSICAHVLHISGIIRLIIQNNFASAVSTNSTSILS